MKKRILQALASILTITCLTGCAKKDLPDSYVAGSDFQYMHVKEEDGVSFQADGKNGKFFLAGMYIYYMDKEKNVVPLCDKADCMHNQEIDEKKQENCNAYTGLYQMDGNQQLQYADGYIYSLSVDATVIDSAYQCNRLQRTKEDGSEKEIIKEWKKSNVSNWIIHRGVCYYVEQVYLEDEEKELTISQFAVKSFELDHPEKEKVIYETPKEWSVLTMQWLQAYGNHLYFGLGGFETKAIDLVNTKNYQEYLIMPEWNYQIDTGELNEITIPELKKGVHTSSITMWKDKLLIEPYDSKAKEDAKIDVYLTELDGSNPQKVMEDVDQTMKFFSDGKYLYMTNIINVEKGTEKSCRFQVFDDNYQEIDSFVLPEKVNLDWGFEIGSSDQFAFLVVSDDKKGMEVQTCDKSKIGSLHGKELPLETVATLPLTEEDSEYLEGE